MLLREQQDSSTCTLNEEKRIIEPGKNSPFIIKSDDPRHGMKNTILIIIYAKNIEESLCIFKGMWLMF